MCSHYESIQNFVQYEKLFNVSAPPAGGKTDMWPKYQGAFVRKPPETDPFDDAVPEREAMLGRWGLVPWMLKPENAAKQMKLSTFNARVETVDKSFTFGGAWRRGQHCIVPVEAFYELDWRSGKAVPTRFTRTDGQPMGIAGLWDTWTEPGKPPMLSFTMLTINAGEHALLRDFHRPEDEKRMIVVLPEDRYADWLDATADQSRDLLNQYPAEKLVATSRNPKPAL